MAFLVRAEEPLHAVHLQSYSPRATLADHDLLAAALAALDARTESPVAFRTSRHGNLVAGPIRYDHLAGVTIGDALMTDPYEIQVALDRAQ